MRYWLLGLVGGLFVGSGSAIAQATNSTQLTGRPPWEFRKGN